MLEIVLVGEVTCQSLNWKGVPSRQWKRPSQSEKVHSWKCSLSGLGSPPTQNDVSVDRTAIETIKRSYSTIMLG